MPDAADDETPGVVRQWPSDADYMRNGFGEGGRFFYPISHTNPNNYLTWETIREFDLLRSHAVADEVMGELAAALKFAIDGDDKQAARDALARFHKITGGHDA